MSPEQFISQKTPTPSAMLSRDWQRTTAAARERAFFMAGVTRAEILEAVQRTTADVAAGKINKARAREIIREQLAALGYTPAPGTEGGIKDLTSFRRLETVLSTNVAMAQGWAGYHKQLAAVRVFPAKRMVRQSRRKEPRDWPRRWRTASRQVNPQGVNTADLSAHIMHPIWAVISEFGNPYPLYAWGSGMGDQILRLDEAQKLGVATLPPPDEPTQVPAEIRGLPTVPDTATAAAAPPVIEPSLNHSLQATPALTRPDLKTQLEQSLHGTARWEGENLVYLDPNGTRPETAENLANIVQSRPYPNAPTFQWDAAQQYVTRGAESFRRDLDALYDLARLVHRTEPMESPPPLWAVRTFDTALAVANFLTALESPAGLPALPGWPFLTCESEQDRIRTLLENVPEGAVVITLRRARTARDLRPLLTQLPGGDQTAGIFLESGTRLRILKTQTAGGVTQIVCEEVLP